MIQETASVVDQALREIHRIGWRARSHSSTNVLALQKREPSFLPRDEMLSFSLGRKIFPETWNVLHGFAIGNEMLERGWSE